MSGLTNINWPSTLPAKPLADTYAEGFEDNVIRSQMDKGASKTRPRFTRLRRTRAVSFILNNAQKVAFDSFYTSILGGSKPFNWHDPVTGAPIVVQMKDSVTGPKRLANDVWQISFNLEILA